MPDNAALIDLLKQPGIHSPEKIAALLGISLDDLSRQVAKLRSGDASIIEAIDGEYRLDPAVTLLDEQKLLGNLPSTALCRINKVNVLQSVCSTNTFLLDQEVVAGRANVCITEAQSAGRGRHGNRWQSAPHRNLMLSISWEFPRWLATISALGLAAGLVVAQRLNRNYDLDIRIKWPNDLLVADDKLGGVLIDAAGESSGACKVVVGIGLNVHQPEWPLHFVADYGWQDLHSLGVAVDRNRLAAQIIGDLLHMLMRFESTGFAPMIADWNGLHCYQDRRVKVGNLKLQNGPMIEGVIQGVDAEGALLLRDDEGQMHRFTDSNVSVRLSV